MPVRVDIPTRVKVDAPVLTDRLGELEAALATAAERALRASATEVLEPRGGYLAAALNPPAFSWRGEALARVTPAERASVETLLARAIATAAGAAGLPPALPSDVPSPLADLPVEPLDETRYNRALGLYTIPAYEDGGADANVQVEPRDEGRGDGAGIFYGWRAVSIDDAPSVYLETLSQFAIEPPSAGYMGPIFVDPQRGLTFGVYKYPNPETWVAGATSVTLTDVGYDDAQQLWVDRPVQLPAMAAYAVDLVALADAGDLDTKLRDFYRPIVRHVMAERRGPLVSNAEFDAAVQTRVQAIATAERAALKDVTAFMRLRVNTTSYLMKVRGGPVPPADLQGARLIPLVQPIAPPGAGEGAGEGRGEGGEGRGVGEGEGEGGEGGEGVEQPPGGFIETPEGRAEGRMFPPPQGGEELTLECVPYLGEPSLTELGEAGAEMRRIMAQIAWRLQILPCEYAGMFLLNAAHVLGARAAQVALWETTETGTAQPAAAATGNLGHVQFIPTASPQVQFLRHLAATVPLFTDLRRRIEDVYRQRQELIRGTWAGRAVSWLLRWWYDLNGAMGTNVGLLFAMTCQVLFLQLLNSSRQAIEHRQTNIKQFAEHFSRVLLPQLTRIEELIRAREILEGADLIASNFELHPLRAPSMYPDVRIANMSPLPRRREGARAADWPGATEAFTSALAIQSEPPPPPAPEPVADHYELVLMADGSYRLLDKRGHLWATTQEIESALILRRGTLEGVEPLIKQFVDLPEVMERFRDPDGSVQAELARILGEMHDANDRVTANAKADPMYGFGASRISENIPEATVPYSRFVLYGVHRTAHEQIGEFFRGDRYYAMGIDDLFMTELGKESLGAFLEFTGIVLLAVVCPPAAAFVGLELAAHHLEVAEERRRVYRSLLNPEQVRSLAEVEAELFAARFGLALSFIPVGGELIAEARAAFSVAAKAGAEAAGEAAAAGGRRAALGMTERATVHLTRVLQQGIVEAFVKEMAKAWLINKVIGWSLEPVMAHLQREWGTTGPIGGMHGAMNALVNRMAAEHAAQAQAPPAQSGGTR